MTAPKAYAIFQDVFKSRHVYLCPVPFSSWAGVEGDTLCAGPSLRLATQEQPPSQGKHSSHVLKEDCAHYVWIYNPLALHFCDCFPRDVSAFQGRFFLEEVPHLQSGMTPQRGTGMWSCINQSFSPVRVRCSACWAMSSLFANRGGLVQV